MSLFVNFIYLRVVLLEISDELNEPLPRHVALILPKQKHN